MARSANAVTEKEGRDVKAEEATAPEGGWSWLIVISNALCKMAFWGTLPCFGIVFADVLHTLPGKEGASVSSVISIFTICLDFAGLCCPALYRRLSFRQVGVAGGIIFFVGAITAASSVSVLHLVITYGAIQGIGFGLMVTSSLASFNEHFRRRRTVAMAVAQCLNSAGSLALPIAVQALQASAGARAAKLALSSVGAAAALSQLFLRSPAVARADDGAAAGFLLVKTECADMNNSHTISQQIESCEAKDHQPKRRAWARGVRGVARRWWRATNLDGALFRDPLVLLVAGGVSLVHVAEPVFFAMLPLHLRGTVRMAEERVASVVAAANAGDLCGRLAMVLVGAWLARRNRLLFASGALASAVALTALSFMTTWATVLALSVVLGVCKGVIYVTFFLTLAEIVEPAKFPSAMAMQFLMQMVFSSLLSPILGLVRDATGSYPACFRVLAGLMALGPCAWGLQAALGAHRTPRHTAEAAESLGHPVALLAGENDSAKQA